MDIPTIDLTKSSAYINKYNRKAVVNSLSLILTDDCNLACTYCFEPESMRKTDIMPMKVIDKSIEFLFSENNETNEGNILIFGGEPMIHPAGVVRIIDYGHEVALKQGKKFSMSIVTNCTMLTEEVKLALGRHFDRGNNGSVQLSVDGIPEVQNRTRPTREGKESWSLVERTIKEYQQFFGSDFSTKTNIHGVLSPENIGDLYAGYKFFYEELNCRQIWFIPQQEDVWKPEHAKIYDEQLNMVYEDVLARLKQSKNPDIIQEYCPLNRCVELKSTHPKPCACGEGFYSVTPNGTLYPCHQFYYSDKIGETIIGDVWNGISEDRVRIFLEYSNEDMSCPSSCTQYECFRCIATNYNERGSFLSQVRGAYCSLMKIDSKYQKKLAEEAKKMGLINNDEGTRGQDMACRCKLRGSELEIRQGLKQYDIIDINKMGSSHIHTLLNKETGQKEYSDVDPTETIIIERVLSTLENKKVLDCCEQTEENTDDPTMKSKPEVDTTVKTNSTDTIPQKGDAPEDVISAAVINLGVKIDSMTTIMLNLVKQLSERDK